MPWLAASLLSLWLPAQGASPPATPLGSRLQVFGADEPDRGPFAPMLAPPLRLADVTLGNVDPRDLTDEERALLLRRARLAHSDRGLFSNGPKDPWRAVALSAEFVALSLLLPPLMVVAASAGHAYAGNWTQAATTSGVRLLFAIWIAIEGGQLLQALANAPTLSQLQTAANNFDVASVTGGAVIAATSLFDLLTAYGAAERANATWEHSALPARVGVTPLVRPGESGATFNAGWRF